MMRLAVAGQIQPGRNQDTCGGQGLPRIAQNEHGSHRQVATRGITTDRELAGIQTAFPERTPDHEGVLELRRISMLRRQPVVR